MSKLAQPNGDDHPEAAGKHLEDAMALVKAQRYDGAAYLAGYVVECAIKALILLEHGWARGHELNQLSNRAQQFAALSGARSARYVAGVMRISSGGGIMNPSTGWCPSLRYWPPNRISRQRATNWLSDAQAIYAQTIVPMRLDGVI